MKHRERRHNPDPNVAAIELECERRLHAILEPSVIEIHCRYCSGERRVFHRWDRETGDRLDDRTEHAATQVIPVPA